MLMETTVIEVDESSATSGQCVFLFQWFCSLVLSKSLAADQRLAPGVLIVPRKWVVYIPINLKYFQ